MTSTVKASADTLLGILSLGPKRSEEPYSPSDVRLLQSVAAQTAIALENRGVKRGEARELTRPLFERFGLAEFEERMPAELSGGMRQRVAFLRTLMAEKDVLLLDEPFAALDSITRAGMQEWLLSALEQEPRTALLVTHDVDEALLLTHRVIVMSARPGRIVTTLETDLPRDRPRREIVTSPEFASLKESALEALEL